MSVRGRNFLGQGSWRDSPIIEVVPKPDPPASVTGKRQGTGLTASWSEVTRGTGQKATGYDVQYSGDDGATWTRAVTNTSSTTATIRGLDNTKIYKVSVRALHMVHSDWATSGSLHAPPTEPTNVSQFTGGVTWSSPTSLGTRSDNGTITYNLYCRYRSGFLYRWEQISTGNTTYGLPLTDWRCTRSESKAAISAVNKDGEGPAATAP